MAISKQPLVSVVIPTYNRADLIIRAINSVQSQSYQNLEIIVVDDRSQDNTLEVVRGIKDDRLNYYRHQSNQGSSAARNTGIMQANGQYIAFLDSDDVWLPQKLELQLEQIALTTDDLDRVVSYTQLQKSDRVFYQPSVLPRRGKQAQETIADYLWSTRGEILTSTLLVSRSLAIAHPFATNLSKHEDWDFLLRLRSSQAHFVFIPQVLTVWHNEPRSDRLSRCGDYQLSLDWIKSYRGKISERAYKGFILKEVVPKMLLDKNHQFIAINLLIQGLYQRIISLDYFLFLVMKQAIPRKLRKSLKTSNSHYCFGITKKGCPRHPLYLQRTSKTQLF